MYKSTRLALAATVALMGASSAAAEEPNPLENMSPEAQALIESGDELAAQSDYGAARRDYREAAELVRADGNLPVTALRRIANAYYFEGSYASAAGTLEELAEEAASFGDLVTEVWAIADAAWIHGKLGSAKTASEEQWQAARHGWRDTPEGWSGGQLSPSSAHRDQMDMKRLVGQLERLLRSPYLPDDVRVEVTTKRLSELEATLAAR